MDVMLFLGLVGFAFATLITPGPNNLLLMSSGALFGWRATLPHIVGIQVGFASVLVGAIFGLGAVLQSFPELLTVVKIGGASWLLWMATRFFRLARSSHSLVIQDGPTATAVPRPFRFHEGVLFQWANPKAILIAVSTAGAYSKIAEDVVYRAVTIGSVFLVVGVSTSATWTTLGELLHRMMSEGRAAAVINAVIGLMLVGTAATILLA